MADAEEAVPLMADYCHDGPYKNPVTVAIALRSLAEWFDQWETTQEQAMRMAGALLGLTPPARSEPHVQSDLRLWADWLDRHPDVDAQLYRFSHLADAAGRSEP